MASTMIEVRSESSDPKRKSCFSEICKSRQTFTGLSIFSLFVILFAIALSSASDRAKSSAHGAASVESNSADSSSGWFQQNVVFPWNNSFVPDNFSGDLNDNPYMTVELRWSNFIPASTGATATLNIHVVFGKAFLIPDTFPPKSNYTFSLYIDTMKFTIPAKSRTVDFSTTMRLTYGSLLQYPFDDYQESFGLLFTYSDATNPADEEVLNFILKVDNSDVGIFAITNTYVPATSELEEPALVSSFKRPDVAKLFPMFLAIAFWLIPISQTIILWPYFTYKKLDNPTVLSMGASLIFAVPSLRNSMPAAPPIGCVLDFASFYWCELFIVCYFVSACIKFFLDTRPAPSK